MDRVKVIKNFLTQEECDFYIKYIDSNINKFQETKKSKRLIWLFGNPQSVGNQKTLKANYDLSALLDVKSKIKSLFRLIEKATKENYRDEDELYVTCFSMTKQTPGAFILAHDDTDQGTNHYFKYSTIIYLNTMEGDGILEFPRLNYSYLPQAGDLVMFPSRGAESMHQVKQISKDRYSFPIFLTEDVSWKINE